MALNEGLRTESKNHSLLLYPSYMIVFQRQRIVSSTNLLNLHFTQKYLIKHTIMGAELSTARWLAPTSFVIDFAAQTYGMLSSPNMRDIHDANISFFSPQPYFIAGFFFPQQLFQLAWLYRLYKAEASERGVSDMVDFAPFYVLGNICIASKNV